MFVSMLLWFILASRSETPLVISNDASQFELIGITVESLAIKDGEISLTGKPTGYFATKAKYKNYRLKFEWRYDRPADLKADAAFQGNSGLLIHIDGPDKVWPRCLEVQLMNADAGNIFAIGGKVRASKDPEAQIKAIKPVGEWNSQVVECRDGTVSCSINGVEISRANGAVPHEGRIGWQSEGSAIHLRKITIQAL